MGYQLGTAHTVGPLGVDVKGGLETRSQAPGLNCSGKCFLNRKSYVSRERPYVVSCQRCDDLTVCRRYPSVVEAAPAAQLHAGAEGQTSWFSSRACHACIRVRMAAE
jgi:hypothetical protein